MRGEFLLILLGIVALFFLSNRSGVAMATTSSGEQSSTSDAIRSRGTMGQVANGWTTGWDGTQSCPPNAMC